MASAVEISGNKTGEVVERSTVEIETETRGAPYKYGLVTPFLRKFACEDEEDIPNSEYYSSEDEDTYRLPNAHEVVKRFLKQVRESNGYDVDCRPPPSIFSPFIPGNPNTKDKLFREDMMRAAHVAIDKINAETGKAYELVQVEKAVYTTTVFVLLTFTVKEIGTTIDASLKTIRAMVVIPYDPKAEFTLEEWSYKPLSPNTEESRDADPERKKARSEESRDADPERKKAKIGEDTGNLERLSSADNSA